MRAFCYIQKKYYKWKIDLIADDLFKKYSLEEKEEQNEDS